MQPSGRDIREFCKNVEAEMNSKIFLKTNSLAFIEKIAEVMERHLDKVEETREASKKWLEFMGLPTRDEIATFAINLIKLEQRLDGLDYELFNTQESIEEYRLKRLNLEEQARLLTHEFGAIKKE
jgi:predicted  nucleic acid-binding Zn-ribbon protein